MLRLIGTDEVMTYIEQYMLPRQNVVYRATPVYDNRGRMIGRRWVQEAGPFNNFVPKVNPYSILSESFLLCICEKKIYEIRKMLKKLNQN